jgi:hypothetical protein
MTNKSNYYAKAEVVVHKPVVRRRRRVPVPSYVSKADDPTDADDADDSHLVYDIKKQHELASRELLRRLIKYHGDVDNRLFCEITRPET